MSHTLVQIYKINAPVAKVWDALTNPATIEKWGGGPAKISPEKNTPFSFWGGDISGFNTEVEPEKLLKQDWKYQHWEKSSRVIFTLHEKNGETTIKLTQTGIPDDEFDDISEGWKDFYLGEIKNLLEG